MLQCPNCLAQVGVEEAKWFGGENQQASVFCCPSCYSVAQRLYTRAQSELVSLLNMLKESIRLSIIEGRLHLGAAEGEVSKKELLEAILTLQEKKDAGTST